MDKVKCEECGSKTVKDMFCTVCGFCQKCNGSQSFWVCYSSDGDGQNTHCLACESKPVDSQVLLKELGNIIFQKEEEAKIFVETFWKELRVPSFEQLRGPFCSFVEEKLKAHVKKKKMLDTSDLVINLITFNCLFKNIMTDFENRFRYDNEEHGPYADVPPKIFDTKFVDQKRFWGSAGSNSFYAVYTSLYSRAFQLLLPSYYQSDKRFSDHRSKNCNFEYDCARLLLLRFREYYLNLCMDLCSFWNDVKNYPVKVRQVKTRVHLMEDPHLELTNIQFHFDYSRPLSSLKRERVDDDNDEETQKRQRFIPDFESEVEDDDEYDE